MTLIATAPVDRTDTSLKSKVAAAIRETILYGELVPGQRLVERELCEQLGVSRTVLREAMQHLQAEGIVEMVAYKGIYVASVSRRDAKEIFEVREVLEAYIGREFVKHASEEQIDELAECIHQLRVATDKESSDELLRTKQRIYETLLAGCGNAIVADMHTQLNNRMAILRRTSLSRPGRRQESVRELEQILSVIRARDIERTGELCAAHVRAAAEAAFESLDLMQSADPSA